jgi:GTP-binding protein
MIDFVTLRMKAGDGGNGRVSFRHEKYAAKGGPDGGDGGEGGNVIIRATRTLSTLRDLAGLKLIEAKKGGHGGRKKQFGERGADVVVEVPVGTVIWLRAENRASALRRRKHQFVTSAGEQAFLKRSDFENTFLTRGSGLDRYTVEKESQSAPLREADSLPEEILQAFQTQTLSDQDLPKEELFHFTEDGQEIILCKGGIGGRGNVAFKGSTMTTPLMAEYGSFGEEKLVQLELKLLADLGLVGFPNAGKSTFLSKVTRANPKIAQYPFTTLEPNLGILYLGKDQSQDEVVIADIPGLVEGASQGKGLGLDFLRHVENCQALMFVLALSEEMIFQSGNSEAQNAELLWQQFEQLRQELGQYNAQLLEKPFFLTVNKIDIYSDKQKDVIRSTFDEKSMNVILFSGVTGEGLETVKKAIAQLVQHH